jgi:hypothetical protein
MREALTSSGLFVARTAEREGLRDRVSKQAGRWNPEEFAKEQIRGLVRQVFLGNHERPVRQVVFSGAEPETEVQGLCWRVGEGLARERVGSIAVAGEYPQALQDGESYAGETTEPVVDNLSTPLRQTATRVKGNLWLVPPAEGQGDQVTSALLHSYLAEMRKQFEYSIVVGPPATESNTATAMGQFADGIVLVLSAHHTRRITARKIKEKLEAAQARLLGTVLSDRVFPIPDGIYRRL